VELHPGCGRWIKPLIKLARMMRIDKDGIIAAGRLGLKNARLEGLNSKVCLIGHHSYGFHGPEPLVSLIDLCAGGVPPASRPAEAGIAPMTSASRTSTRPINVARTRLIMIPQITAAELHLSRDRGSVHPPASRRDGRERARAHR
jgi:hypothetical protein